MSISQGEKQTKIENDNKRHLKKYTVKTLLQQMYIWTTKFLRWFWRLKDIKVKNAKKALMKTKTTTKKKTNVVRRSKLCNRRGKKDTTACSTGTVKRYIN